jgi:hypothetical protein
LVVETWRHPGLGQTRRRCNNRTGSQRPPGPQQLSGETLEGERWADRIEKKNEEEEDDEGKGEEGGKQEGGER